MVRGHFFETPRFKSEAKHSVGLLIRRSRFSVQVAAQLTSSLISPASVNFYQACLIIVQHQLIHWLGYTMVGRAGKVRVQTASVISCGEECAEHHARRMMSAYFISIYDCIAPTEIIILLIFCFLSAIDVFIRLCRPEIADWAFCTLRT